MPANASPCPRRKPPKTADLILSLDVICHLVKNDVFNRCLRNLCNSATRFVIGYSSNRNKAETPVASAHARHRKFTNSTANHQDNHWQLAQHIPNRFPDVPKRSHDTRFADFHILERSASHETSQTAAI